MTKTIEKFLNIALIAALAAITIFLMSRSSYAYSEVKLRQDHAITDRFIRLGDVFTVDEYRGDRMLAPAPKPGETLTLGYNDLQRIVEGFDLIWLNKSQNAQISLTRDAQVLEQDDIEDMLRTSELSHKIGQRFDISFNSDNIEFLVPTSKPVSYNLKNLQYDVISERFSVEIAANDGHNNVASISISGIAPRIAEVPVLTKRVRHGDVIELRDVDTVDIYERDLQGNIVTELDRVVGMTARRFIKAREMISDHDLMEPRLVHKNDIVTLKLVRGPINLSTQARALSEGARGDTVQVMNQSSKKIVEAVVTGPKQVALGDNKDDLVAKRTSGSGVNGS